MFIGYHLSLFCLSLLICNTVWAETTSQPDSNTSKQKHSIRVAQPLAGTDELGRMLPGYDEVGGFKANRRVGIFYFLWQGDDASKVSEQKWDLNEIIPNHPEVLEDGDHENWGSPQRGRFYYWGKPIYGYYRGDDEWVHLRNMQLLTDAQVDFLVIDATNALIYETQSDALMRAMRTLPGTGGKLQPTDSLLYQHPIRGPECSRSMMPSTGRGSPRT